MYMYDGVLRGQRHLLSITLFSVGSGNPHSLTDVAEVAVPLTVRVCVKWSASTPVYSRSLSILSCERNWRNTLPVLLFRWRLDAWRLASINCSNSPISTNHHASNGATFSVHELTTPRGEPPDSAFHRISLAIRRFHITSLFTPEAHSPVLTSQLTRRSRCVLGFWQNLFNVFARQTRANNFRC